MSSDFGINKRRVDIVFCDEKGTSKTKQILELVKAGKTVIRVNRKLYKHSYNNPLTSGLKDLGIEDIRMGQVGGTYNNWIGYTLYKPVGWCKLYKGK